MFRWLKDKLYTPAQVLVREATRDNEWKASDSVFSQIVELLDTDDIRDIQHMLYIRLCDSCRPRHVYKALVLLEHLIDNGNVRFLKDLYLFESKVERLRNVYDLNEAVCTATRKKAKEVYNKIRLVGRDV